MVRKNRDDNAMVNNVVDGIQPINKKKPVAKVNEREAKRVAEDEFDEN